FYCDPPYSNTERYYDKTFQTDDHERLKAVLSQIKGRFILSYNDDEYIRELYKDYEIIPIERQNNLSRDIYKELIIKNF
ncbi:MAG: DNA adenine methylase, partial [Ruminococcus sp.]|nr:DNA adenine methylase [Ruminococcus sp.]